MHCNAVSLLLHKCQSDSIFLPYTTPYTIDYSPPAAVLTLLKLENPILNWMIHFEISPCNGWTEITLYERTKTQPEDGWDPRFKYLYINIKSKVYLIEAFHFILSVFMVLIPTESNLKPKQKFNNRSCFRLGPLCLVPSCGLFIPFCWRKKNTHRTNDKWKVV